jgi:hypothetical protein
MRRLHGKRDPRTVETDETVRRIHVGGGNASERLTRGKGARLVVHGFRFHAKVHDAFRAVRR